MNGERTNRIRKVNGSRIYYFKEGAILCAHFIEQSLNGSFELHARCEDGRNITIYNSATKGHEVMVAGKGHGRHMHWLPEIHFSQINEGRDEKEFFKPCRKPAKGQKRAIEIEWSGVHQLTHMVLEALDAGQGILQW